MDRYEYVTIRYGYVASAADEYVTIRYRWI